MIQQLQKMKSRFLGEGINHEGQPFKASFEISSKSEINGISFTFEAKGNDGTPFHLESSLVGQNMMGQTALWVLSSNHPGIFERFVKKFILNWQTRRFVTYISGECLVVILLKDLVVR